MTCGLCQRLTTWSDGLGWCALCHQTRKLAMLVFGQRGGAEIDLAKFPQVAAEIKARALLNNPLLHASLNAYVIQVPEWRA